VGQHWKLQAERGVERVAVGDFSYYDHVLDTAVMVGAVPARFGGEPFDRRPVMPGRWAATSPWPGGPTTSRRSS
jgi:hypothetical protein